MTRFKAAAASLSLCLSVAACTPAEIETPPSGPIDDAPASAPTLTEMWVLDGFDAPESVIQSADPDVLYVSNAGGEGDAKDGNGVISKISINGTMIDRNWVVGTDTMPLNGPKGMAVIGDVLAVADIDRLVLINTNTGDITDQVLIEGTDFLNDVAAGPDGAFLVSNSRTKTIFAVKDGAAAVWLQDDRLEWLNGLHNDGERLLVATMPRGELLTVDWNTKAITGLASGMENADGIGIRNDGSYIISSWPGQLWHVRDGETPTLLQDTSGETGAVMMNDILLVNGETLVTPNWMPGTVRPMRSNNPV